MTASLVLSSTRGNARGLVMAELFPPLTMLLISPLLQSVTHLRPQIPALTPRCQAKTFPFKTCVNLATHYKVCLFVSCLHNRSTTGSWSTNKTYSNNHSSPPQKPFPKAGKPERSSSLYTTLQYFQPPNAQRITSVHCLTASWGSLWAIVFLSLPTTSLWTVQMLKGLVHAALQEFIHRNRACTLCQTRPSAQLLSPFPSATANAGCRHR